VLEIGIGSGLNLPSYRQCAEEVYGVDPSTELLAKTSHRLIPRESQ
jgi:predicted TPR repeat methyltransferase